MIFWDRPVSLWIGGQPVVEYDNALAVSGAPGTSPARWRITYRENHDAYTVETEDRSRGLMVLVMRQPAMPIAVNPLDASGSVPPQFRWKITPVAGGVVDLPDSLQGKGGAFTFTSAADGTKGHLIAVDKPALLGTEPAVLLSGGTQSGHVVIEQH
ncbi:I66 family serine proteinase inhibitor [Streptomyces sp. NPDC002446]